MRIGSIFFITIIMAIVSCNSPEPKGALVTAASLQKGSFGYDLDFLSRYDRLIVLKNGDAQVVVSPKYQGKVFTSTANGEEGKSFGWINYKAFDVRPDAHMNAYGGENRLWLGPEGGPYSLFFPKGARMEFLNWKTPAAFDTEPWQVIGKDDTSVVLKKQMELSNYAGTLMEILVSRRVSLLDKPATDSLLNINSSNIKWVGYRTENTIQNRGTEAWDEKTGMPCIWILDMFPPSDQTTVVIPYKKGNLPPANTNYFGEIPPNRIRYQNNVIFFKADGKQRGKLGIRPESALPVAGSYDAEHKVLTIILFDVNPLGKYLNQQWRTDKPPFSGDAVNSYNDGPLAEGGQLGPFYELESVSASCFLQPGQSATHWHSVFHFTGNEKELDAIAMKVFGVSIDQIKKAF